MQERAVWSRNLVVTLKDVWTAIVTHRDLTSLNATADGLSNAKTSWTWVNTLVKNYATSTELSIDLN
jgi:hypothetical protein